MKLTIHNLNKEFKKKQVLKGIDFEAEGGCIYGIIGYNGAGKTVMLKCICDYIKPETGTIELDGRALTDYKKDGTLIGALIDGPALLANENAYNNLKYLYTINKKADRKFLESMLAKVGLDADDKRPVSKYSTGMKQRLAMAMTLMENPEILILDEPLNGIDKKGTEDIKELIREQKAAGKIILLTSHHKDDIDDLCDEVYEMDEGHLNKLEAN